MVLVSAAADKGKGDKWVCCSGSIVEGARELLKGEIKYREPKFNRDFYNDQTEIIVFNFQITAFCVFLKSKERLGLQAFNAMIIIRPLLVAAHQAPTPTFTAITL